MAGAEDSTLFWVIVLIISLAFELSIAIAITVPVVNVLTRYRVNYLPRAVSLDRVLEDGRTPISTYQLFWQSLSPWNKSDSTKIGPDVRGFWGMARRIIRMEGTRGLYKGASIMFVQCCFSLLFGFLTLDPKALSRGRPSSRFRDEPMLAYTVSFATMLLLLPFEILTRRTMVAPGTVNWMNPRTAFRQVLSSAELQQPWRLYLIPGLVPLQLLRQFLATIVTRNVRNWTVPGLSGLPDLVPSDPDKDVYNGPTSALLKFSLTGFVFFVVWVVLMLALFVPFDCVLMRLMTQYERSSPIPVSQDPAPYNHHETMANEDVEEDAPLYAADMGVEPVIALRPCYPSDEASATYFGTVPVEPYRGIMDCIHKMTAEEGAESLLRGSFCTIAGYLMLIIFV
ncbi:hypothetical protein ACI68E_000722 [Malassezia pachydermatis]|uniref:Mitochondrial carrier n=1 Tax=Malassezia pachydermatis TaxID=77020 RepID=A0A0M8MMK6_9BASI|nr:hypothetical protein Malapachy_2554 [Malassezia pachydermatis]KOS15526.1 hypothetical protein Malapachy_2554 [Malassezia pachydermatis]